MLLPKGDDGDGNQSTGQGDDGRQDVERTIHTGGHQILFKEELGSVGQRLQQAERPNPIGSPPVLDAADEFALEQHRVGHGGEKDHQHYGDLQTTQ